MGAVNRHGYMGEDYRLKERCSIARRLWEDSQRDFESAGQAA